MHVISLLTLASAFLSVTFLAASRAGPFDNFRHDAGSDGAESGPEPIVTYEFSLPSGNVRWGLLQAANKLNGYLYAHEDVFSGSHFTDDLSRFSIGVAKSNDAAVDGLLDLIATLGEESQNFQLENV